mgnify:CR=1 FL=1
MGSLIIFGKYHSWDNEIELEDDSEFGMDITIVIKERVNRSYTLEACTQVRNNCTEFHHLYNKKGNAKFIKENKVNVKRDEHGNCDWDSSSAFESGIHCTGGTLCVNDIESITVVKATKRSDSY